MVAYCYYGKRGGVCQLIPFQLHILMYLLPILTDSPFGLPGFMVIHNQAKDIIHGNFFAGFLMEIQGLGFAWEILTK